MGIRVWISGYSGEQLLREVRSDWPIIRDSQGGLQLAPEHNGQTLRSMLDDTFSSISAQKYDDKLSDVFFKRINDYIQKQNKTLAEIRRDTKVTDSPHLVMAPPVDNDNRLLTRYGWELLHARLQASGAKIEIPESYDNIKNPYEVWPRDRYVLKKDGTALFQRDRTEDEDHNAKEYNEVTHALMKELQQRGIKTKQINSPIDGGDVLQHPASGTVFVGVELDSSGRIQPKSLHDAQTLASELNMKLVTVSKPKSYYYHLDTFMSVLPNGSAIVLPDGTDAASLQNIRNVIKPENLLELPPGNDETGFDRRGYCSNLVTVNGNVFCTALPNEMKEFLEKQGFKIYEGPHKIINSGPHCQINFLERGKGSGRTDVSLNVPGVDPANFPKLTFNDTAIVQAAIPTVGMQGESERGV